MDNTINVLWQFSPFIFGGKILKGRTRWCSFMTFPLFIMNIQLVKKKIKIKNWDWLILAFPWTKFGVVLVTIFMQNSEKKNKLMLQRETTLTPQNNLDIFPPSSRDGQNWVLKTAWKSIIGHLNREYSISFNENYWKGSNKWRF